MVFLLPFLSDLLFFLIFRLKMTYKIALKIYPRVILFIAVY